MHPSVGSWVNATFGEVADVLFEVAHLSSVTGLRLRGGGVLVIKVRGRLERARACVAAQAAFHNDGFPCPAPLSPVVAIDGRAVHAEEYIPGRPFSIRAAHNTGADDLATLLADLILRSRRLKPKAPQPAPMWLAWDHHGPGTWPPLEDKPPFPDALASEGWLTEIVERIRQRLARAAGDLVVGHGDWEAQNMAIRESDGSLVVHDWDSLSCRSEPALVGAAAATFASGNQPTLSSLDATEHFIGTYQSAIRREFTRWELESAWAAGLWLAAHNARMELLYAKPRLVCSQLAQDGLERVRRAGA